MLRHLFSDDEEMMMNEYSKVPSILYFAVQEDE